MMLATQNTRGRGVRPRPVGEGWEACRALVLMKSCLGSRIWYVGIFVEKDTGRPIATSTPLFQYVGDDLQMMPVVDEDELERLVAIHRAQKRMCEPCLTVEAARHGEQLGGLIEHGKQLGVRQRFGQDERGTPGAPARNETQIEHRSARDGRCLLYTSDAADER